MLTRGRHLQPHGLGPQRNPRLDRAAAAASACRWTKTLLEDGARDGS